MTKRKSPIVKRSTNQQTVTITAQEIVRATEKAVLIRAENVHGRMEDVWLPLSQIEVPKNTTEGDANVDIIVPQWIATEKELA